MALVKRTPVSSAKLQLLARIPAFAACSARDLDRVARLVDHLTVAAGQTLIREGQIGREAFLVADGTARVEIDGEPLATVGPGELVGEMSLADHRPRSASVVAETELQVLVISPSAFDDLVAIPAAARLLTTNLATRLRDADARAVDRLP